MLLTQCITYLKNNKETIQDRIEQILLVSICILLPWMIYGNIKGTLVNLSLADIIFIPTSIYILLNIKRLFKGKNKIFIGYFVLLIISLIGSHFTAKMKPELETVSHFRLLLEIVKVSVSGGYFFIAYLLIRDKKRYKRALYALVIGSIPVIIVGFGAYVFSLLDKPFFLKQFELGKDFRFKGSFQDPNLCAFYFLMIFYVGLFFFNIASKRFIAWSMGIISIFSLTVIILTLSRGGWLALGISFLGLLIIQLRKLRKETILIGLIILLTLFLMIQIDIEFFSGNLISKIMSRIESALYQGFEINRIHLYKASFEMGSEHFLFGVGKGNFILNEFNYLKEIIDLPKPQITHNTLLGCYAQQGATGLIIFILVPIYILYNLIKKRTKNNQYFIIIILAWFIFSLSINTENIRFLWFLLGTCYSGFSYQKIEEKQIYLIKNKKSFALIFSILLIFLLITYFQTARKLPINIYVYNGNNIERTISLKNPGTYNIEFDIHTDKNSLHKVEVYNDNKLIDTLNFKNAYGHVKHTVNINNELNLKFVSSKNGWMCITNAIIKGKDIKRSLLNYILLPNFIEYYFHKKKILVHNTISKPLYKELREGENEFNTIDVINVDIIKHSNLTTQITFGALCNKKIKSLYQLDLRFHFDSLSKLLPNEIQRNIHTKRLTLHTNNWAVGKIHTRNINYLISVEKFQLLGRFYDYTNKRFIQDTFFPIQYKLKYKDQDIKKLGEENWVNICYDKDKEDRLRMFYNGWVETKKYDLEPGKYNFIFNAKGCRFENEFSKIRIRDNFLNEQESFFLNDEMEKYNIDFSIAEKIKGVSFILELINYKSKREEGRRIVFLAPYYKLIKKN